MEDEQEEVLDEVEDHWCVTIVNNQDIMKRKVTSTNNLYVLLHIKP